MDLKNVKNAHYFQIDNKIKEILEIKGVEILPIAEAWKKYDWLKNFISEKPHEGYFIWVKKQINFPITTCIGIKSKNVKQNLFNVLIIEKNVKAKANVFCGSYKEKLKGVHNAKGIVILKRNSSLEYFHVHLWHKFDTVIPSYKFILEDNAKVDYVYKNLNVTNLNFETEFLLKNFSSLNLKVLLKGENAKGNLKEKIYLEGKNSNSQSLIRIVANKNSLFNSYAEIEAKNISRGHLDCQGIILDKKSKIKLTPSLNVLHKDAVLTHEAAIGKISEDIINYLRARGLTKKEAIELIVRGFLK